VKLTTLIEHKTLLEISKLESLVDIYNLKLSCISITFSPNLITLVGPLLYLSPLIKGIRNDSILSISVINSVFPKRIANSMFVKIFSSCNDITSN
jgi:hypothetical protein